MGYDRFLPKGGGEHRGTGIVRVVWKVCVAVVNCRITRSVMLHDALHGFSSGSGTGTETLESNLAQQFAGLAHDLLLQVFLDVQKVYGCLDRGRCMEILWGYRMDKIMSRLISHHWDNLMFVPKAKRFLGTPFGT